MAVLAIAYHNIGVEQEFLKRFDQSMISYTKGMEIAERYLGARHTINLTLKDSLAAAKQVVAVQAEKAMKAIAARSLCADRNSSMGSTNASSWRGASSSTRGMKKLKEMAKMTSSSAISKEESVGSAPLGCIDDVDLNAPPFNAPSPSLHAAVDL